MFLGENFKNYVKNKLNYYAFTMIFLYPNKNYNK